MATPDNLGQSTNNVDNSLQQPREDLQTSGQGQDASNVPQSPSVQQDQLNAKTLGVPGSNTSVPNNTTIHLPKPAADYWNAQFLWLLIPIILAVALFWPKKGSKKSRKVTTPAVDVPVLDMAAVERANTSKSKKSKKSKSKKPR